jgi:hypothetical protein
LDDLDQEREALEDVVDEADGGLLVEGRVDAQHPQPGAVVDGGELVVLALGLGGAGQGGDELDVDLDLVAGQLLLGASPAPVQPLVALRGGQTVHVQPFEDPPHPRRRDTHVVVAAQVHRDLGRPEVVVAAQVDDLVHHVDVRLVRAAPGPAGTFIQAFLTEFVAATVPGVEGLAGDAVLAAGHGHIAGDFFGVVDDGQAASDLSIHLLLAHPVSVDVEDPKCQAPPSVLDLATWLAQRNNWMAAGQLQNADEVTLEGLPEPTVDDWRSRPPGRSRPSVSLVGPGPAEAGRRPGQALLVDSKAGPRRPGVLSKLLTCGRLRIMIGE